MINSFVFGFDFRMHWCCRIFLGIGVAFIFPILIYFVIIIALIWIYYQCQQKMLRGKCKMLSCKFKKRNKLLVCACFFPIVFLRIVEFLLILPLTVILGSLIYVIFVVYLIVFVTIVIIRMLYQWCLRSKKGA